jgi:serine/threonine protein phosphatase PrpC
MQIAIPSKGRAGQTKSDKVLPSAVMYVPESELHQYEQFCANVVAVPNDVKGITPTRNWILKNCGDEWVVFVDDDVKNYGWTKLLECNVKQIKIEKGDYLFLFTDGLTEARNPQGEELGTGRLLKFASQYVDKSPERMNEVIGELLDKFKGTAQQDRKSVV